MIIEHQILGRLVHGMNVPLKACDFIQEGLVLLLQVLYPHKRFPKVTGLGQRPVFLDPLHLLFHVSGELLELQGILQLLPSVRTGVRQLGKPTGEQGIWPTLLSLLFTYISGYLF